MCRSSSVRSATRLIAVVEGGDLSGARGDGRSRRLLHVSSREPGVQHSERSTRVVPPADRLSWPWSIGGGNLVALQRGDDIGPHNTIAAQKKAFPALSTRTSTSLLAERASADPVSRNLTAVDSLLLFGGGFPIMFEREVVGAVGVAGSGGSAQDEACATKGVTAGMADPSLRR